MEVSVSRWTGESHTSINVQLVTGSGGWETGIIWRQQAARNA
jgi:hypothetical protein